MLDDLRPIANTNNDDAIVVIAGPCSAESEEQVMTTAQQLRDAGIRIFRAGVWKPRTKPGGFEGVGAAAFPWLRRVASSQGMKVAVEVATPEHTREALAAGIDILWIGARTTTNPFAVQEIADTLVAAGRTDVSVLVKNPMSPDIDLWDGALQRFYNAGVRRLAAVHRGFTPYSTDIYRNTPQWKIATELMLRYPTLPVYCDPSHMGGRRDLIAPLARTALSLGFAGLMIESHYSPDAALSDAAQQITPAELCKLLATLHDRRPGAPTDTHLSEMRFKIDAVDAQILDLLSQRMEMSREIGKYKKANRMSVLQPIRFNDMLRRRIEMGNSLGLSAAFVERIMRDIHDESVDLQVSD